MLKSFRQSFQYSKFVFIIYGVIAIMDAYLKLKLKDVKKEKIIINEGLIQN